MRALRSAVAASRSHKFCSAAQSLRTVHSCDPQIVPHVLFPPHTTQQAIFCSLSLVSFFPLLFSVCVREREIERELCLCFGSCIEFLQQQKQRLSQLFPLAALTLRILHNHHYNCVALSSHNNWPLLPLRLFKLRPFWLALFWFDQKVNQNCRERERGD